MHQRGFDAGADTGMPGRQRRRDAATPRCASIRPCRVPRQPAAGAIALPSPARLHRGRAGADVPAGRRRHRRRGARSWRRHIARRIRQSRVPLAGRRALALATRRLRSRVRHPWLLSRRLSLRCIEGGQARTGATAGARAAAAQPVGGRRHLDGARSREHARPTFSAPSNSPSSPPRLAGATAPRSMSSRAMRWRKPTRPSTPSVADRRDRHMSLSCAGPAARRMPMRRSFRCAARASVSIPAATTSSRRAACCG